jgi:hypothetical protein
MSVAVPRQLGRRAPVQQGVHKESLVLNVFPVEFSADKASIWIGRWESAEAAQALQNDFPGLRTWRDTTDGSRLYIWYADAPGKVPPGFQQVTIALDEAPQFFERILTEAVERRLNSLGFERKGNGFVNYGKGGLFAAVPALAGATDDAIGIFPKVITRVFFSKDARGALLFGLVVDVVYTTRMDVSAAEWIEAGLTDSLLGKYVVLIKSSAEAQRIPDLAARVIGRIDGIRDGRCVLGDLRDARLSEIPLDAIAPEPTRPNLDTFLMARYEKAFTAGEEQLTKTLRNLVRPKTRYKYARAVVLERLQGADGSISLPILSELNVRFSDMLRIAPETIPARRLLEPEYSFDAAGNNFARRVDSGLRKFGPYDAVQQRNRPVRLLVVAPAENKGDVRVAIQKLLEGVKTQQDVFSGLKKMYRLHDLKVTFADVALSTGSAMKGYADAVHRALRDAAPAAPGEPKFHLIVTIIREAHRALRDSENPYFQSKAVALVADGIPTQAVTIEKLRQKDYDLQYILNTMALACYAKLGRTSHVLKLPPAVRDTPTELVFGVGRSFAKVDRFGEREEVVGFATVFRANGEYLYNDSTPYCDDVNYERALEETIKRTVDAVARFEQLPDNSPLRLIFHVPRRPGRREERAILNAVGKIPKFNIEFALVHVNDDHDMHLFDLANTNPQTMRGPKREASLLAPRGMSVSIGPRERLVTFVGVDQYRGHGSPSPLRITLDRRSTFQDIEYVTQQLFFLSFMNAGSLNPGVAPVTIAYAERLAALTGRLRGVQQWTVELIQDRLGRRLWFI